MASKAVFSEQAEQFTIVVHALLQNKETRATFAKEPLATLEKHGIVFKDPAVAKKVEAELAAFAGKLSDDDLCPPWTYPIAPWPINPVVNPFIPFVRTVNIAWAVKPGDIDDVIRVDQPRVDAFVTQVSLEARIAVLEARIAELETNLAKK
jgi:hypothetical protein